MSASDKGFTAAERHTSADGTFRTFAAHDALTRPRLLSRKADSEFGSQISHKFHTSGFRVGFSGEGCFAEKAAEDELGQSVPNMAGKSH